MSLTLRRLILPLLLTMLGLGAWLPAEAACTAGACVTAGPRLASVDSNRGALLNLVMGGLLGGSLNVTAADWNTLASGDVSLARTINALQVSTNSSTPAAALSANATVAQVISAAATAASGENLTSLAASLNTIAANPNLPVQTIQLGDLLQTNTATPSTTRLNALDLVSGAAQLYNYDNVLTTPQAIAVSPTILSAATQSLVASNGITAMVQVIEPPAYVCGGVNATFHTAAIRIKLDVNLLEIQPPVTLITALFGISSAQIKISHVTLYLELAHATGTITAINAAANTMSVNATPGVAALYLGSIPDNVFFNRSHAIVAGDLDYGTIGTIKINSTTVNLGVKSSGSASPSASSHAFSAPYPSTWTYGSGATSISTLLSQLSSNLQTNVSFGALDVLLLPVLKGVLGTALNGPVSTLLNDVLDPVLELLGVRIGEVDVTATGTYWACGVAGVCYSDANHSGAQDYGESGTGQTLYAKLVSANNPTGPISGIATVNTSTGAFSFTSVPAGTYNVIIDNNTTGSDVTPTLTSGWIAIEPPTLTRSVTVVATDISGQLYGIYNGSKLTGTVFKDDGTGGGTANNGVREGGETTISGAVVKVTDNAATTIYDTTLSANAGGYTLWIPAAAGATALKLTETNQAGTESVAAAVGNTGGTYTLATDTIGFTHVIGSLYTGANFGDVLPAALAPAGQQRVLPGAIAFYRHTFAAGTAGTLALTSSAPTLAGWTQIVYVDTNCNGALDTGETAAAASIGMTAAQSLCLLVRVQSPETAAYDTQWPLTLTATYSYANSAIVVPRSLVDLTTTGNEADAGLKLVKTVDKATAKAGDVLVYTVTYSNVGSTAMSTLSLYDSTPAYTVLTSATCGSNGAGLTGCSVAQQPAVGAAGPLRWDFVGSLTPGGSGTVTFSVTIQ